MEEDSKYLPEAVKKQVEEAKRLQREAYGPQGQGEEATPESVDDHGQQPSGQPEAAGFEETNREGTQSTSPESDPGTGEEVDWERRFRRYKGQTDRKLFEERQANGHLRDRIAALEEDNKALRTTLNEIASKQKADPRTFLPPEVIDGLGEEMATDVAKVAELVAQKMTAQKDREIEALKQSIKRFEVTEVKNRKSEVVNSLLTVAGQLNGYDLNTALTIDRDPEFHRWLSENRDPFSGRTFMELYHTAGSAGDTSRVADLQKRWRGETDNNRGGDANPFAGKVTPDRVPGERRNPDARKGRMWTTAEIQRFYHERSMGKISEEKATALENDLFAAQREGRIVESRPTGGRAF